MQDPRKNFFEMQKWYDGYKLKNVAHMYNPKSVVDAMLNTEFHSYWTGTETYEAHMEHTSVLSYNDENSLSCVVTIAYFSARRDYTLIRELPAGKGFADIVFLPRIFSDKPALIVELKWNKSAEGAINQIKERKYVKALEDYRGDVLLVAVNYDKVTKKHKCVIEKFVPEA